MPAASYIEQLHALLLIVQKYSYDDALLMRAVAQTFSHRRTPRHSGVRVHGFHVVNGPAHG